MSQFRQPLKLTVAGMGEYVNGVWTEAPPLTVTIQASVQPVTANDVINMPIGDQYTRRVKVYTDTLVRGMDSDEYRPKFQWRGRAWLVESIEDHQMSVIPHFKLFARQVES